MFLTLRGMISDGSRPRATLTPRAEQQAEIRAIHDAIVIDIAHARSVVVAEQQTKICSVNSPVTVEVSGPNWRATVKQSIVVCIEVRIDSNLQLIGDAVRVAVGGNTPHHDGTARCETCVRSSFESKPICKLRKENCANTLVSVTVEHE